MPMMRIKKKSPSCAQKTIYWTSRFSRAAAHSVWQAAKVHMPCLRWVGPWVGHSEALGKRKSMTVHTRVSQDPYSGEKLRVSRGCVLADANMKP